MKERFNRVFGIVIFTELLLFCALVAYVQFQTNTYNFLAWVLICCSAVLINIAGYVFGILPYVQEVCNRVSKIQEVLREIDNHLNLMVEDNAEFENSINVLKNQLTILKVEGQREDVFFEQYKEMIIPNVKLIYDMAKNKNDREIKGLAKSLIDIIEKSIYSRRIFVPLWYEVMYFQTILSGCVYSAMNNLEIVINIQEEELKQSLILHGILTLVATLLLIVLEGSCLLRISFSFL